METIIEQRISFETAKLAKEKGFFSGFILYKEDGKLWHTNFIGDEEKKLCSAPTQGILQKWLRVNHDLILIIDYVNERYFYFIHHKEKGLQRAKADSWFTYEKALEAGLQDTLKLIENE